MRRQLLVTLALATALLAPAAARADIVVATEVLDPAAGAADTDIALVDATTGTRFGLPAGVNTAQDELHPSITPDGKRLVFERSGGGTIHVIAEDLPTGQQADLFNAFDVGQFHPHTPAISADGQTVLTGADTAQVSGGFVPTWTQTSLAAFPAGPFSHVVREETNRAAPASGRTLDPSGDPNGVVALGFEQNAESGLVVDAGAGQNAMVFESSNDVSHPALSSTAGVVVFETTARGQPQAHLAFRTLGTGGLPGGSSFALAPTIGTAVGTSEVHPALTPDGRFVVFLRQQQPLLPGVPPEDVKLFVFDTATQKMLNPQGVDIGHPDLNSQWLELGGASARIAFVLVTTQLILNGPRPILQFLLKRATSVGILVQRIVGHHRLFGRRVPKLRTVGRVPFGQFLPGRHRVHWNLRVDGKRLRPGAYLVTARALTRKGVVRDLGTPHRLRIR